MNTPRLQVTQGRYGPKSRTNPEDYLSLGPPMASPTRFHSSKTTLGAAVEAFFADRDLAPATRRAYRATDGSLIQAFGTEMPVTALTFGGCGSGNWLPARKASLIGVFDSDGVYSKRLRRGFEGAHRYLASNVTLPTRYASGQEMCNPLESWSEIAKSLSNRGDSKLIFVLCEEVLHRTVVRV